jgi:hypothetical protein
MGLITKRSASLLVLPILAVAVAGCATDFTGGGTIPSTDLNPADQANFGFTYKITNTATGAGHTQGAYHDPTAPAFPNGGVKFKFDRLLFGDSAPGSVCTVNGITGIVNYISQNPNYPGSGLVLLSACDNGEPGVGKDAIEVDVFTGPYAGYSDTGVLTGGNLQAHQGFTAQRRPGPAVLRGRALSSNRSLTWRTLGNALAPFALLEGVRPATARQEILTHKAAGRRNDRESAVSGPTR